MQRISTYEYTRIIGERAEQIARNAQCYCDVGDLKEPIAIAEKEFRLGVLPLTIVRRLPNGEIVKVDLISKSPNSS